MNLWGEYIGQGDPPDQEYEGSQINLVIRESVLNGEKIRKGE